MIEKDILDEIKKCLYDGITFVEVSFLIGKYIQRHPQCTPYDNYQELLVYESKKGPKKDDKKVILGAGHIFYRSIYKKWRKVLNAFDVKGIVVKNKSFGEKYEISISEAIFMCQTFDRMEKEQFIWKKIRNVNNDEYHGFLDIYYLLKNKGQLIEEIDCFIHDLLNCLKDKLSEPELIEVERHLLFVTQRQKLYMLESVEVINYKPNRRSRYISKTYYFEYVRFLEQMKACFVDHVNQINHDFIEHCGVKEFFNEAKKYQSSILHEDAYPKYIMDEGVCEPDNFVEMKSADDEIQIDKKTLVDFIERDLNSQLAQANLENYRVLDHLRKCLQEIKPITYKELKYCDLKNPKVSDIYSNQDNLPISFPSDFFYASMKLSKAERAHLYQYYNDYNLDI